VNIPQIPVSQISGFTQFTAKSATVFDASSTTSFTYVDLSPSGPTLTGVADGSYIFWFGCTIEEDANVQGLMSLSFNGSTPFDFDGIYAYVEGTAGDAVVMSISRALSRSIANGGNNTIQAKYKSTVGGTVNFMRRWLIALRVGA
jgi:hypothetical protein